MRALTLPPTITHPRDYSSRLMINTAVSEITADRGIHLTGLFQVSGSPGPGRPWAFDARRIAPLARRRGWLRLGLRVRDQVPVAHRVVADGEFEHAVEDQPSA